MPGPGDVLAYTSMMRIGGIATLLFGFAAFAQGAAVQVNPGDFVSPTFLTLSTPAFIDSAGSYSENGVTFTTPAYFYVYQEFDSG